MRNLLTTLLLILSINVSAVPLLQLDIPIGDYDHNTQDSVVSDTQYGLTAILNEKYLNNPINGLLTDSFYLSFALVSEFISGSGDYGSFTINGNEIAVTADMIWGTPPSEDDDIAGHGIYDTWYYQYLFDFSDAEYQLLYDAEWDTYPGNQYGYFMTFDVDVSNLVDGIDLHHDLYNLDGTLFAPMSHDAQYVYTGDGGDGGDSCNPLNPFDPCEISEPKVLGLMFAALLSLFLFFSMKGFTVHRT